MAYAGSEPGVTAVTPAMAIKILVAGGFGVGKTTLVGAISEIRPLRTEELLSDRSIGVDDTVGRGGQDHHHGRAWTSAASPSATTSCSTCSARPGQDRFWFMWDELALGALGAVVLADTRRLADCFPAVDYFEQRGHPVRRRGQLLRRGAAPRPGQGTEGAGPRPGWRRSCSATRASASRSRRC